MVQAGRPLLYSRCCQEAGAIFLIGYLNCYQDEWNEPIIGKNKNNSHPFARIGECLVIFVVCTMLLFCLVLVYFCFDLRSHSGLG